MAQSPQTTATIYSLKSCDPTYKNVMYFPDGISVSNRLASMSVKTPLSYTNLQYIRDDGYVELPVIYDTAHDYNYIMYNNGEGEGSIFAFITNVEFLNFECTRFYIKKDVWMNYYKTANRICLVERTHSKTVPYISDISITPSKRSTYYYLDNNTAYKFAIMFVFNESTNLDTSLCMARTITFIYDVTSSGNIQGWGKTTDFKDLKLLTGKANVCAIYLYYVPTEMTKMYEETEFTVKINVSPVIDLPLKGYRLKRPTPLVRPYSTLDYFGRSFTNTYGVDVPFNRYPYTQRILTCSSGEYELDTQYYNGNINITTYPFEGVNGVTFRHDIYGNGVLTTIFETSAKMPLVTDSFSEFIEYNSNYTARQTLSALTQLATTAGGVYLTGTATANSFSKGTMSYEQQRNILGNKMMSGGAGILGTLSDTIFTLDDAKKRPDKVDVIGDAEKNMTFMLPNMFAIQNITLNDDDINYCKSIWNTTGYRFKKIMTLNYNVGKYYTYVKALQYKSNIRNSGDAQEFESILMNGTTIWNMTNASDYKEYGNYVSYEENIIS